MMNFPYQVYSRFEFDDIVAVYVRMQEQLGLMLLPRGMEERIPAHRKSLKDTVGCRNMTGTLGNTVAAVHDDEGLAQFFIAGDDFTDSLGVGHTMLFNGSGRRIKFVEQRREESGAVRSCFRDDRGVEFVHLLAGGASGGYLVSTVEFTNSGSEELDLDMLASFSLCGISPFHADDAPDALKLHRFRSFWSAEGRHECRSLESLGMEMSWCGAMVRGVRFGQRSSLVVKEYFPVIGVEDAVAGVTWAAELATVSPWQLELTRQADMVNISGGLPDREFSGYRRRVAPGESVSGIPAVLTCVRGDMQSALNRMNRFPVDCSCGNPVDANEMPVIFNEYCRSWGNPSEEKLLPAVAALKGSGVKYFVLDAGWFRPGYSNYSDPEWLFSIGDWRLCEKLYPGGFDCFLDRIRQAGMVPGIWFEFEVCTDKSQALREHRDWLISFEGGDFTQGRARHFWDFRKKEVWRYLDDKVIQFLRRHRIGYMKSDYNAAIAGVDCANGSTAAGLQEQMGAVREYFLHLRRELPELVLEICASGGHRLSPEWMRIGDMGSFSDAHEAISIPIVAAHTSMLVPFRGNQVWSTLRRDDELRRTAYSLAAGFLGRLCLSGDVAELPEANRALMLEACRFYRRCVPVLRDGESRLESHLSSESWNHPRGWQLFRRRTGDGEVLVLHSFADAPDTVEVAVRCGRIAGAFHRGGITLRSAGERLEISGICDFEGIVVLLEK